MAMAALKSAVAGRYDLSDLIDTARNLLRRNADRDRLERLLQDIEAHMSDADTAKIMDKDTQIEGHKDTSLNRFVETDIPQKITVSPDQMQRAFPKLFAELRFAKDNGHCTGIMDDLARYLALGDVWQAAKAEGRTLSFMVLGYLLEKVNQLRTRQGYLVTLLTRIIHERVVRVA